MVSILQLIVSEKPAQVTEILHISLQTEDPSQARPMTEKSVITDSVEAASAHSASSHLSYIDIGTLNLSLPKRFSTALIKKILTTRFIPRKYWKPPQRQFGRYRRRVPEKLFNSQEYPTLQYSVVQDGLYCAPCVVFQNTDAILISKPLQDWSNAIRHTMYHLQSKGHMYALQMSAKFLSNYEGKKSPTNLSSSEMVIPVAGWEQSDTDICHNHTT